jgi:hypothetical protein
MAQLLNSIAFNLDQQYRLAKGEAFYRQAVEQHATLVARSTAEAESLLRHALLRGAR